MLKMSDGSYMVNPSNTVEESPSKGRDAKVPPRVRLNFNEAKAKSHALVLKSNFFSRYLEQLSNLRAEDQAKVRTAAQAVLVDKSNEEAIKARGEKDSVSEEKLAAAVASLCSDIGLAEPLDDYATLESKGIAVGKLVAIGSDDFFLAREVQKLLADRRATNRTACVNGDKDAINKMLNKNNKEHKVRIAKGLYPRLSTSVQVAIAERLELCGTQIFNPTSMCASIVSTQALPLCFETSQRAIDSSKNQPNRLRFGRARAFQSLVGTSQLTGRFPHRPRGRPRQVDEQRPPREPGRHAQVREPELRRREPYVAQVALDDEARLRDGRPARPRAREARARGPLRVRLRP